jgi:hypothetical protein
MKSTHEKRPGIPFGFSSAMGRGSLKEFSRSTAALKRLLGGLLTPAGAVFVDRAGIRLEQIHKVVRFDAFAVLPLLLGFSRRIGNGIDVLHWRRDEFVGNGSAAAAINNLIVRLQTTDPGNLNK